MGRAGWVRDWVRPHCLGDGGQSLFLFGSADSERSRGHELVTGGPYGWIRHPGYLAALLQAIFSGVALGSWVSMIPVLLMLPLLFVRAAREDRFLRGNLAGYSQYAHRVRYRLVPGIW